MIPRSGTWQKRRHGDAEIPRRRVTASRFHSVSLLLLSVLAAGFWMGNGLRQPTVAHADVRRTPQREAFRSGGARSETVLREIAATLKRIDRRLERMERAVLAEQKP